MSKNSGLRRQSSLLSPDQRGWGEREGLATLGAIQTQGADEERKLAGPPSVPGGPDRTIRRFNLEAEAELEKEAEFEP